MHSTTRCCLSLVLIATAWMVTAGDRLAFAGASAHRDPAESYEQAIQRVASKMGVKPWSDTYASAEALSVPVRQLSFANAPEWYTFDTLIRGFFLVRETRFLFAPQQPTFARRSTWFYPDDGCYARAALAGQNLERSGWPRPHKLFAFGNLRVKTKNHPLNEVTWWYHVVPVVRVGVDAYVLDPAVSASGPMRADDWFDAISDDTRTLKATVCNPYSYDPFYPCHQSTRSAESGAIRDQLAFLSVEYQRLLALKRNVNQELGESPNWQ